MSSIKGLGFAGTGTAGILAGGLLMATLVGSGVAILFGMLLILFVAAGALALLKRSGF